MLSPLRPAAGLRELVLGLHGQTSGAAPGGLSELGRLTQLRALQLSDAAIDVPVGHWSAALAPLTRLTRLGVRFARPDEDFDDGVLRDDVPAEFPWGDAVSGLIHLRELRMMTDTDGAGCRGMFSGALPATLSRLTALRHLELLGTSAWTWRRDFRHLQLAALPALETAALRLQQIRTGHFESLRRGQRAELSRLVSLSLTLRVDVDTCDDDHEDTHLPTIAAPLLTELILDTMKLAPDSEQLSWLPDLPRLRRLELTSVQTASDQLPQGIAACSGLTELVLRRIGDIRPGFTDPDLARYETADGSRLPERPLRALPDGPYISNLVHLSLSGNAFSAVPFALVTATALEVLDLDDQRVSGAAAFRYDARVPVQDLHLLGVMPRLRRVYLAGFRRDSDGTNFEAAHPHIELIGWRSQ